MSTMLALAAIVALLAVLALPGRSLGASAPLLGSVSVSVAETTATLEAQVRPGGLDTTYRFWLDSPTGVEAVGEGQVPSSRLEEVVSVGVESLEPTTTYTFWVSAENTDGQVTGDPVQFATSAAPPPGDPGGSGAGPPVGGSGEPWNQSGAQRAAEEAVRLEAERVAKKTEEEAAARDVQAVPTAPAGSAPTCRVPALRGKVLAQVRSALRKADCSLGKVTRPRRGHPASVVVGQGVKSGSGLPAGAAVAVRLGARRT
jgi:hypothetical protein